MRLFGLSVFTFRDFLRIAKLHSNRLRQRCLHRRACHDAWSRSRRDFSSNLWTCLRQLWAEKPILLGLSFATIGWIALTLLLRSPFLLGFVAGHVFYMIGIGFSYSNLMTTGMNLLSEDEYGDGNTLFNTLQQFSGAVATAIVATIINLAQQSQSDFIAATVTGSQLSLLVLLALLLAVFTACLVHFRNKPALD